MGLVNLRRQALDPIAVRAITLAYDESVDALSRGASEGYAFSHAERNRVARTVIELAEQGLRDPAKLRDIALARLTLARRAADRRQLASFRQTSAD